MLHSNLKKVAIAIKMSQFAEVNIIGQAAEFAAASEPVELDAEGLMSALALSRGGG